MSARLIKSFWKRLCTLFSTRRSRKDARSNSDQNVDGIPPSDSHKEVLYQNMSDNGGLISESTPTPLSELQLEQPSTSSVGPADEHGSSQFSKASEDSDSKWGTLPKVTIFATIETGQVESTIKVPKQRNYTGRKPVIPSSLANIPCATLGVQGALDRLNVTLGTSQSRHAIRLFRSRRLYREELRLWHAYGRLRSVWKRDSKCTIEDELRRREEEDKERRRKALEGDGIWTLPPRRARDPCSNRVVPWWVLEKQRLWPISHAWVDEQDRVDVWTPIDGNEWPVPIPKDASLDLIHIEMLNLGAEYTWLDVLCLRQKGGSREDLRVEEWKLDVPTIGYVYQLAKVVIYLGGLGQPLTLKEGDLDSDRCWFRRAWTLQEVGYQRIIAGDTPDGPMHAKPVDDNGNYDTEILTSFRKQLKHMEETIRHYPLFGTLADMQNRVSTNPVDRAAGLAFCLGAYHAYHESETVEDAWTALVNAMDGHIRAHILFLYPGVGLGGKKWRPTWVQVMSEPLPADAICDGYVYRNDETDEDWYEGHCIQQGFVRGLDAGSAEGVVRGGELIVRDPDGIQHTFKILATHQSLIPEGPYTLLGATFYSDLAEFWVVGRSLLDQRFKKLSLIRIPDEGERKRLCRCGFVQRWLKTYLL